MNSLEETMHTVRRFVGMPGIPHGPGYLVNRNLKSLDSLIIYLRLDRGSDLEENLLGFCTKGKAGYS